MGVKQYVFGEKLSQVRFNYLDRDTIIGVEVNEKLYY